MVCLCVWAHLFQYMVCLFFSAHCNAYVCLSHLIPVHGMSVCLTSLQHVCFSHLTAMHGSTWYVCLSHLIAVHSMSVSPHCSMSVFLTSLQCMAVHGMSVFLTSLQYIVCLSHLIAVCQFFSAHCNALCVSFSAHSSTLSRKPTIDKEQVEEDLQTVGQISELCSHLAIAHQVFIW